MANNNKNDKEKSKAEELAEAMPEDKARNPLIKKANSTPPTNDYRDEGDFTLEKRGKAINDLRGEERALAEADHERKKEKNK